jgi:Domain of unknown function (DUF1918)
VPAKKKSTERKATAKKVTAKKVTAKKVTAKKVTGKKPANAAGYGDLIFIDSPKVGSPAREGEILEVIQGEVSVSYRVRWADGRQTLITPSLGVARIVTAKNTT